MDGRDVVDEIRSHLSTVAPDVRTLIDVVDIDVGAYWQTQIADLIEASDKVVVIVTDGFWKSKNCLEEYNMALLLHKERPAGVLFPIHALVPAAAPPQSHQLHRLPGSRPRSPPGRVQSAGVDAELILVLGPHRDRRRAGRPPTPGAVQFGGTKECQRAGRGRAVKTFECSRRLTGALAAVAMIVGVVLVPMSAASADDDRPGGRTPVVLFPAWHFTRLKVTVHNQRVDPICPRSGTFEDLVYFDPGPDVLAGLPRRAAHAPLRPGSHKPMRLRFSEQPGRDGLDRRLRPDRERAVLRADVRRRSRRPAIGATATSASPATTPGSRRTWRASSSARSDLIEATYRENGRRPVHLVGHSNGPIYVQYLLTHTSEDWKAKYIHGFTPLAGNFPGQGLGYALMFVGINIPDLTFPATPENGVGSATMFLSHPSTYITASDPGIFGDKEVVIRDQSTGVDYTPKDYRRSSTMPGSTGSCRSPTSTSAACRSPTSALPER